MNWKLILTLAAVTFVEGATGAIVTLGIAGVDLLDKGVLIVAVGGGVAALVSFVYNTARQLREKLSSS